MNPYAMCPIYDEFRVILDNFKYLPITPEYMSNSPIEKPMVTRGSVITAMKFFVSVVGVIFTSFERGPQESVFGARCRPL